MSETDFEARLAAVERAVTDDETDLTDVRDDADLTASVEDLESRLADLKATVDELDAALQAVRGYAGNVRAVNRDVERRASAALAKAETLEASVDDSADAPRIAPGRTDRDRNSKSRAGDRGSSTVARDGATAYEDRNATGFGDGAGRGEKAGGATGSRPGDGKTSTRHGDAPRAGDDGPSSDGRRTHRGSDGSHGGSESPTERFVERVRDAL